MGRDAQLEVEQDNLTELLERYAPFFAWLHFHRCIQFSPPGFERVPVNGRLRFYVKKKLLPSELKDDWWQLWLVFQTHRDDFINIPTEKHVLIPATIEGWRTEVIEKP